MSEIPKIFTPDGFISKIEKPNGQELKIETITPATDYVASALKEDKPFEFVIRSGHAQLGIDITRDKYFTPKIDKNIITLEGQKLINRNPLLTDVMESFRAGDEVGRIVVMDPELRIENIEHYLHKKVFIDTPFNIKEEKDRHTGHTCHYAEVSLLNLAYQFEEDAISSVSINRIIKEGRAKIETIRSKLPNINLQKTLLNPGDFFVGAIRISLGDIVAVVDTVVESEQSKIRHLPATILDPFRTSRIRQVELVNNGNKAISLDQIKIKIRFFKAENPLSFPLQKEKIRNGYTLADLVTMPQLETLFNVYDEVKNSQTKLNQDVVKGKSLYGTILNKGKVTPVPEVGNPESDVQREIIKKQAAESIGGKKEDLLTPKLSHKKQKAIQRVFKNLSIMGGRNSKLWLSNNFPTEEIINTLRHSNIRTFLSDQSSPFLDSKFFRAMIDLTHKSDQPSEFLRFDRENSKLQTFHHGLFMEPDDKERFDKVRYWFAFYGSHTDNMDDSLLMTIFSILAGNLNGNMGIIQGCGPGVMQKANSLARKHNVFSAGVGIDLAYKGQNIINSCDGFAGFLSGQRHQRAHTMDKMVHFPIINTGGYGSFEEIASTLTSLKLYENPLAPILFLDPDNLWGNTHKQIQTIADRKLGQKYIPNLCIPVQTAEEGASAIMNFLKDPQSWYQDNEIPKEDVIKAQQNSRRIRFQNLGMKNTDVFKKPFK